MNKHISKGLYGLLLLIAGTGLPMISNSQPQSIPTKNISTLKQKTSADLLKVKGRIIKDLLEPEVETDKIRTLVKTLKPDGTWPGINYVDTSRTGFQHSVHLENMLNLAIAFRKPGSPFIGNADVKKTLSSALDYWIDHDFISENWWWNEMGTPNWMINTLLVFDTDLTQRQRTEGLRIAGRANLEGFGARPGGDLIPIAGMLGKQGLFKGDEAIIQRVAKVMAGEVVITTGRGLQPDQSFHHRTDNVISIHTYGTGYASSFSYWAAKLAGTSFMLPAEKIKIVIDYYIDGISKAMSYSTYPDPGAKNRDITRKGTLDPAGTDIIKNLMAASDYRKNELQQLINIRRGKQPSILSWNRFFWNSAYFVHQRKHYFTSIRMHSSRQNNMEMPYNEEGLKNHHYADGSNFISRTAKEYVDIFPVWDWQKIPGTTVVQKPALPHWNEIAKKGLRDFTGGVSDGNFGAAAFDFSSPHDPLQAKKAWFLFDREYVCLGTGINSTSEFPVATTLNQCLLVNDVVANAGGSTTSLKKGEHQLNNVSWVVHDSIAYIFPNPGKVNVGNNVAKGNWRQINHHPWSTTDEVQKDVFTLWLDHGRQPQAANYAYIVVSGLSSTGVDQYNKKGEVVILSNTAELQAVHHRALNLTSAVFYKQGSIALPGNQLLSVDQPCLVMVKTTGKQVQSVAVSDPKHKLTHVTLRLAGKMDASGESWSNSWDSKKNETVLRVKLPGEGYAGQSVVVNAGKQIK
ncbi:chondroitin lyase [Segetibacter sp. 3557_3]|uniref:polysaccharide lyase family 8 super-sandwich domain-containing protein n=1 Tax=Segetibacter sp. 3557_3 TaxID=2547429 RepID=UPI00105855BB|nr:polysaccharide lyase family 8 super-sandwich domain-containing protein [Segetibacter sp. 3557_3]TDH28975.1 chondroitin lyase [Segetibacter sp. 3557_3]